MADDSSPWNRLLALCAETKEVQFQQIIEDNCEAKVLPWNDGSGGHMFRLGSSPDEERLVHVTPLRPQDASTHTKRIRMASELSKLRSSGNNRTSAFFVDARTSIVHDKFPKGLWDALSCYREGQASKDTASAEDLQHPGYYLVTEIQSGWRPLSTHKFTELAQLESVLGQACLALAVAEAAVQFEHRLPIIDTVLIRPTRSPRVEYTLWGNLERIPSAGFKIRLQGLHVARMTIDGKAEYSDLSRHRQFIVGEKELHVFDKIADTLGTCADRFKPHTNAVWLKHLAEWLTHQNDAGTSAMLEQWGHVLSVAASAEDAAEEAAETTDSHPTNRRPAPLLRPRRKKPKLDEPKQGDKPEETDERSATSSAKEVQ
ncbi:serine/threonine-protein kinase haspin-like [Rhipicephalus microplus]|uniref:serine/threonine-protein kinase haspin-like n=1 Tax=Rhipicephalus microplus TaxID=6941 RepID=UPI003F6D087A